MNTKEYLMKPVRIVLLSAIGLVQLLLVYFGCIFVSHYFQQAYPAAKHLQVLAIGMAFLTLYYPVYILMAAEKSKRLSALATDTTAIDKLVEMLLSCAVRGGADKIVFGEPTQPFEVEQRECPSLDEQVAAGSMTDAERAMIEGVERMLEETQQEGAAFDKEVELLLGYPPDPFHASPVKEMPRWLRSNGKWHQEEALGARLFSDVIASLERQCDSIYCLKSVQGKTTHKVRYSVGIEKNFCYSITINEVEATSGHS